jgi:hypothetical protein
MRLCLPNVLSNFESGQTRMIDEIELCVTSEAHSYIYIYIYTYIYIYIYIHMYMYIYIW